MKTFCLVTTIFYSVFLKMCNTSNLVYTPSIDSAFKIMSLEYKSETFTLLSVVSSRASAVNTRILLPRVGYIYTNAKKVTGSVIE